MKPTWKVKPIDHEKRDMFSRSLGINEIQSTILLARGIESLDDAYHYLNPRLSFLYSPFMMKGMDTAVKDPRWIEYTKKMYLPRIDVSGNAAVKYLEEWTSRAAWLLYDAGGAENSPADFGIERP